MGNNFWLEILGRRISRGGSVDAVATRIARVHLCKRQCFDFSSSNADYFHNVPTMMACVRGNFVFDDSGREYTPDEFFRDQLIGYETGDSGHEKRYDNIPFKNYE